MVAFACPRCAYTVDAATGVNMREDATVRDPQPGDITVCMACGAILEFRADGAPRWLTFDEFLSVDPQAKAEIARVVVAIVCQRPSLVRHGRARVKEPRDA